MLLLTSSVIIARIMVTIRALLLTTRPRQQVKNLIIFAPLIFSGLASDPRAIVAAFFAFVSFCLASGSVYIVNDLRDRDIDAHHPKKRLRPAALGTLSPRVGYGAALILTCASLVLSWFVSPFTLLSVCTYGALTSLYTVFLKHQPVFDVVAIALGFVLRVLGGITAVGAITSPWILGVTFFGAWHIASTKREAEQNIFKDRAPGTTRTVLRSYSPHFLRRMSNYTALGTGVVYGMYSIFAVENPFFLITIIPFGYALYQYLSLIRTNQSDDPTEILVSDPNIRMAGLLYLFLVLAVLY